MKSAYEKQDYFKVVQILKVLQTIKFTSEGIKFTGIEQRLILLSRIDTQKSSDK